jgi:hypothetical protein
MLERIHRDQVRSQNPDISQDLFGLRQNLDRFIGSCNSLRYLVNTKPMGSAIEVACWPTASRPTFKKKQIRELQEEFWDHQRRLSLALANAILYVLSMAKTEPYTDDATSMTCLDMQRANTTPDSTLAPILREAEKQHELYERVEKSGRERNSPKPNVSRADELEWEICLRRYFEYLDSRSTTARSDNSRSTRSDRSRRSSSLSSQRTASLTSASGQVRYEAPTRNFSYRAFRQGGGGIEHQNPVQQRLLENSSPRDAPSYNEIFTRPRRNSTASTRSNVSNNSGSSQTNSRTSAYVSQISPITDVGFPGSLPMSPTAQWQRVTLNSAHKGGSPPWPHAVPSSQETSLKRAWDDIVSTTPHMPPGEARAYIQGRLAGLDPTSTAQIRRSLSTDNMMIATRPSAPSLQHLDPRPVHLQERDNRNTTDQLVYPKFPAKQNVSEQQVNPQQLTRAVPTPIPTILDPKPQRIGQLRTVGGPSRPKLGRRGSKKRMAAMRIEHTRSLSTIIERPSTAKSKASKAESAMSRKSLFSLKKEKPPPMPELLQIPSESRSPSVSESVKSAGSSTLRGSTPDKSRIIELDETEGEIIPKSYQHKSTGHPELKSTMSKQQQHQNLKSAMAKSKHSDLQSPLSKKLPLTPADLPPQPNPVRKMASLFGFKKFRKNDVVIPDSQSTPHLVRAMQSSETLHKASLDCLRKNGSKSTLCLVAIQEGPEQPFQVWLSALPYIEGRAATPSPKV